MKKCLILLIVFCYKTAISQTNNDTSSLGTYRCGMINTSYDTLTEQFIYNQNTIFLKKKYANGNLHFEFHRFGEKTFVYTEYFENPTTIHNEFFGTTKWHIKREGLVYVSSLLSGDTIITFNPQTFEEVMLFDSLLMPIGKWKYYYPDGHISMSGSFSVHGKDGEWYVYGSDHRLSQILYYKKNVLEKDSLVNQLFVNSVAHTAKSIDGAWLFYDPIYNTEDYYHSEDYSLDSNSVPLHKSNYFKNIDEVYQFFLYNDGSVDSTLLGAKEIDYLETAGDTYVFFLDGKLYHEKNIPIKKTYTQQTKEGILIRRFTEKALEEWGKWTLIDFETLEFELNNRRTKYKIMYLTNRELTLQKIKE